MCTSKPPNLVHFVICDFCLISFCLSVSWFYVDPLTSVILKKQYAPVLHYQFHGTNQNVAIYRQHTVIALKSPDHVQHNDTSAKRARQAAAAAKLSRSHSLSWCKRACSVRAYCSTRQKLVSTGILHHDLVIAIAIVTGCVLVRQMLQPGEPSC